MRGSMNASGRGGGNGGDEDDDDDEDGGSGGGTSTSSASEADARAARRANRGGADMVQYAVISMLSFSLCFGPLLVFGWSRYGMRWFCYFCLGRMMLALRVEPFLFFALCVCLRLAVRLMIFLTRASQFVWYSTEIARLLCSLAVAATTTRMTTTTVWTMISARTTTTTMTTMTTSLAALIRVWRWPRCVRSAAAVPLAVAAEQCAMAAWAAAAAARKTMTCPITIFEWKGVIRAKDLDDRLCNVRAPILV